MSENIEKVIPNVDSKSKEERNVPDLRFIEKVKLKSICEPITYGLGASAVDYDGIHKYIRITDIDEITGIIDDTKYVSPEFYSDEYLVNENDILFARTGASVGKTYIHNDQTNTYYAGFLMRIRLKEHNPYYIYQQFKTNKFNNWLKIMSQRSGQPGINAHELGNYDIVVMSIENENFIANLFKIIDIKILTQKKIIESKKSLKKSLYQHYFKNKERLYTVADVTNLVKGKQVNNKDLVINGEYDFINGGIDPSGKYNKYNAENCISISEGGNSCGFVNYIEGKFWSGGHNYTLNIKSNINQNYLYHYLKYKENEIMSLRVGSGLPNIQKNALENYKLYLPSENERVQISCVLDTLLHDIKLEEKVLQLYQSQKDYLLNHLFI